jgi:hypothetical protein
MLKYCHDIGFWEKRQFFRRKLQKTSNPDFKSEPFHFRRNVGRVAEIVPKLEIQVRTEISKYIKQTTTLYPGGIRSHDPQFRKQRLSRQGFNGGPGGRGTIIISFYPVRDMNPQSYIPNVGPMTIKLRSKGFQTEFFRRLLKI